jgi:26S proteasome regulatory subunit N7
MSLSRTTSVQDSFAKEESLRKSEEVSPETPEILAKLYTKLKEAEQNFSELEIRDVLIEIGDYFLDIKNFERSLANYNQAYSKAATVDSKLDITLKVMLVAFKTKDRLLLKKQVDQANLLFDDGGDWEKKNRFKAYEAVYFMMIRNFKQAAFNFLDILATFTSTELVSFTTFVKYTVLTSIVSLDRATISKKVVASPEVLSVINEIPEVNQLLTGLYKCDYKSFFIALCSVIEIVETDEYIGQHARYWAREMRVVAYSQFLESYRSVTLASMAASFGISVNFLDKELCEFIYLGRLTCKIDKVNGVIESCRPDTRSSIFQNIVKNGDFLLNRLQKLARVMDV